MEYCGWIGVIRFASDNFQPSPNSHFRSHFILLRRRIKNREGKGWWVKHEQAKVPCRSLLVPPGLYVYVLIGAQLTQCFDYVELVLM